MRKAELAIVALIISFTATGACMAFPIAHPELSIQVWNFMFWVFFSGFIFSSMYLVYVLFFRLSRLWFAPFALGVILIFATHNIINSFSDKKDRGIGFIGEPSNVFWITLILAIIGAIVVFLYYRATKGIWPFNRKGIIYKSFILQELIDDLDNIDKVVWNIHSLELAIDKLYKWYDSATLNIDRLFGQNEAKKLIYIKHCYKNRLRDDINSFYNEKNKCREYLSNLLDNVEKHPELWN